MAITMESLTIQVDPDIAQAYHSASEDEQTRMNLLFNLFLKYVQQNPGDEGTDGLKKVMDEIGEEVKNKGLTPEILESILDEK